MIRQQIAKTSAETEGQHLDNVAKELEIQARINEITEGKTEIHVFDSSRSVNVVFGNLPNSGALEPDEELPSD